MARGERRGIRERDERLNRGIGDGRAGALGEVLHEHGRSLGKRRGAGGGERGGRKSPANRVAAAAGHREERPFDPPGRRNHENRSGRSPMKAVHPLECGAVPLGELTQILGQSDHSIGRR
jgi:hypothetical protein